MNFVPGPTIVWPYVNAKTLYHCDKSFFQKRTSNYYKPIKISKDESDQKLELTVLLPILNIELNDDVINKSKNKEESKNNN